MTDSLREQFQSEVDEFINDLQIFATGSYLNENDKELWDPPFDADVLPELKHLLEIFLDTAELLDAPVAEEDVATLVKRFYENLESFNEANAYAVLEPEEKSEIEGLVHKVLANLGVEDEVIEQVVEFE